MGCSPPGSSVRGNSPGKNTGVVCHFLLQGIFPTQGSNPGLRNADEFFTICVKRLYLPIPPFLWLFIMWIDGFSG